MQYSVAMLALTIVAIELPQASTADDAHIEFFERRIRPVLVQHCYECHSADAKKLGGGLLLDRRQGVQDGGDSGPAVLAGSPDESLLLKAIRYDDDAVNMPPRSKLPAEVIADFETWIKDGAADPREAPAQSSEAESWAETMRQRADWWSLRPIKKPPVPVPANVAWSQDAVDRFILAKLNEQGLSPSEPANARTLARRLSLVLTGLPPSPEDVASFVADPNVARFTDTLLNSPHFGERWARHWMDVVRFTETHGNEWNYEVHHAWRYRDYLIRAFNADVPFDQFIREHIAGDLLPEPDSSRFQSGAKRIGDDGTNESIIGTGFYRFGEVNHDDCISLTSLGYDIADNQIDTLTKAFQATTVACARCHNHKLDAISMEDYYALLGVLRSSRMVSHSIDSPNTNAQQRQRLRELKTELRKELAAAWLDDAQQIADYMQAAQASREQRADVAELSLGLDPQRLEKWIATLAAEKQSFDDPFEPWRILCATDASTFPAEWARLSEQFAKEDRERGEFNQSQFVTFADFRVREGEVPAEPQRPIDVDQNARLGRSLALPDDWQFGGQAMHEPASESGDFVVQPDGDSVMRAILPAGRFTHSLSDKLNGTLRSPVLPLGKKNISFQVIGQRSSAVRLVSNNCQLNYKNYRALTSADWQWITFTPPDNRDELRTYAELMTMFDNPKFPDQLAALGGDNDNYRMPWDEAAKNPRSYFGITRVVLHDVPEPPKSEVTHLRPLFDASRQDVTKRDDVLVRYVACATSAVQRFADNRATDDDVRWLDALLRRGLLGNAVSQSTRLAELTQHYRQTEAELALPRVVAGIADGGPGIEQPIFVRGDCMKPGPAVSRRYVEVLSNSREAFHSSGSGRLELAARIASPDNPLTARVIVNRVWHHLYGIGLVRTVDDFGHVGELPSHPELLDHLAAQFINDGWSIKKLIRSLVLTQTFQQANVASSLARDTDPQNRLLSHYPARRLEAEAVRDSILSVSGRLDRTVFGQSVQPYRETAYVDRRLFPGPLDGNGRRSIYIKNNLMESPKFLAAFNLPGGKVTQGRRDITNVPAQALALLNDPFVLQQADVWASRLIAREDRSVAERLQAMFEIACNRPMQDDELAQFARTVGQMAELHSVGESELLTSQLVWKQVAHSIFNLSEFIHVP